MPINQDQKGRRAEEVAWHYLKRKGYELLAQRYRTPYGEIDLICKDQGVLVMVEVKYRKQNVMEAIGERQKQRITEACEFFLAQYSGNFEGVRFDAVLISPDNQIAHILNAWSAEDF